jgi:hypothetical protein
MRISFSRLTLMPALLAGGLLLALPAAAQVYKWTDANGRVTYSSTPPPGNQKADPVQLRGVETYNSAAQPSGVGGASVINQSQGGAPAAPAAAPAPASAPASGEVSATNANCADGRTNCARGEAPEMDYPDRANERVRPQFTIDVRPKPSK